MSEGFAAAARNFSGIGHEPPLSPEQLGGGLRVAASTPEPAAPEPAPTPAPLPPAAATPAPAPEADAPAPNLRFELFLRLVGGERLQLESFGSRAEAEQRARRVSREFNVGESWPLFGTRYVNPAAVVSIDVDVTGC